MRLPMASKAEDAEDSVGEEGGGYGAGRAGPAESDPEEREHVREVEPLVEGLVVADAAEVEQVHHEEVGEVDEDGGYRACEGPSQDEQRAADADRRDDELLRRHARARYGRVGSGVHWARTCDSA